MNTIGQMERIYKYAYLGVFSILAIFMLSGCASMRPPVIQTYDDSIENYRYFGSADFPGGWKILSV